MSRRAGDTCSHLRRYCQRHLGGAAFTPIQRSLHELWKGSRGGQATASDGRPTTAVQAAFICLGCAQCCPTLQSHTQNHYHRSGEGHELVLDVERGELYCSACGDYIYDPSFDRILTTARVSSSEKPRSAEEPPETPRKLPAALIEATPLAGSKRKAVDSGGAAQNGQQSSLEQWAVPVEQGDEVPPGLRGLNNLGNTCFMASVLQALLHVPLLCAFYLGGGHPRERCPRRRQGPCLSCELDAVFAAAYCGERAPFSPSSFLHSWWRHAEHHLAGYQQQDAHEFYLYTLSGLGHSTVAPSSASDASPSPRQPADAVSLPGGGEGINIAPPHLDWPYTPGAAAQQLHTATAGAVGGSSPTNPDSQDAKASCSSGSDPELEGHSIVQRVFEGLLRSDVTCCACGHTSTAYDPFLDISLDIDPLFPVPPIPGAPPRSHFASRPKTAAGGRGGGMGARGHMRGAGRSAVASKRSPSGPPSTLADQATASGGSETSVLASDTDALTTGTTLDYRSDAADGIRTEPSTPLPSPPRAPLPPLRLKRSSSEEETGRPLPQGGYGTDFEGLLGEGYRSNAMESSAMVGSTTEASSAGEGSSVLGRPDAGREESLSSPLQAGAPRPSRSPDALACPLPPLGPTSGRGAGGGKRGRSVRCGACHCCRNKHLKKACLRNKAERDSAAAASAIAAPPLPPHAVPLGLGQGADSSKPSGLPPPVRLKPPTPRAVPPMQTPTPAAAVGKLPGSVTLLGCLHRFVRPESLGPSERWECNRCKTRQRAVKQMSIRRLPPMMCIHIKRFEHSPVKGAGRKLNTPLIFPSLELDVKPFLSSTILRARYAVRGAHADDAGARLGLPMSPRSPLTPPSPAPRSRPAALPTSPTRAPRAGGSEARRVAAAAAEERRRDTLYQLCAVVCHKGHLHGGHYIAYIRGGGRWYQCDDAWVGEVDEQTVHNSQAYMLFYGKKPLSCF